jgi:hypothetical protein
MRIINYLALSCFFTTFIFFTSCGGYKPIFSSKNLNFKISSHLVSGDKRLGNQLYTKISKGAQNNKDQKSPYNFNIFINISKNKEATVKNTTGKILEYKIILNTNFKAEDAFTKEEFINSQFNYSISYKVQDKHFDTIKTENKAVEDLISKISQEILIKISETIK